MFAVETQSQENVYSDVQNQAVSEVYLSHGFGVAFSDDDPIAQNEAIQNALAAIAKADPDDIVRDQGFTNFTVNVVELPQFLHLVYCHIPEGKRLQVDFDGIFTFQSADEMGVQRNFNAQLITLSEKTVQ